MEELENGVTESVADSETETQETEVQQDAEEETAAQEETAQQDAESIPNSVWAAARKRSEREAQERFDRERAQIDKTFEQRFAGYKNPKTGAAITSMQDYFDALDAQNELARQRDIERVMANQTAEQAQAIRRLIENDPEKARLKADVEQMRKEAAQQRAQDAFNADFAALQRLEPSIKTMQDLTSQPCFEQVVSLVKNNGLDLVTAYKAANYQNAAQSSAAAGKQAAINAARGKSHLAPHDGASTPGNRRVMSNSMLQRAREAFPDKSDAELEKLYNEI